MVLYHDLARPRGLEPPTRGLGNRCSILTELRALPVGHRHAETAAPARNRAGASQLDCRIDRVRSEPFSPVEKRELYQERHLENRRA